MLTWSLLVAPYGRFGALRENTDKATRSKEMGRSSIAEEIWIGVTVKFNDMSNAALDDDYRVQCLL
jgi:hypothetical protein